MTQANSRSAAGVAPSPAAATAVAERGPAAAAAARGAAHRVGERLGRREVAIVVAILSVFTVVGVVVIAIGLPMSVDEAVYATRARQLVTGIPATAFAIYRPPGLPVIGTIAGLVGWSDEALRTITLAMALATLGVGWLLARIVFDRATALLALLAIVGAASFVQSAWTFRNDIASSGLVLGAMAIAWHELELRERPTRRLLLVAPLCAAAFYVRFGAMLLVVAIGVVAVVLWWRTLRRHRALAAATALIGALLLVPHLLESYLRFRDPLEILARAREVASSAPFDETVRQYAAALFDGRLTGWAGLVLVVFAIAAAAVVAYRAAVVRDRDARHDARRVFWLAGPPLLALIPLLVSAHPEIRYLIPVTMLTLILGAAGALRGFQWMAARLGRPRVASVLTALLVLIATTGALALGITDIERIRGGVVRQAWLRSTGEAIRQDSGARCAAVARTRVVAILNWYAACPVVGIERTPPDEAPWLNRDAQGYVVITYSSDGPLVPADLLAAYRPLLVEPAVWTLRNANGQPSVEVFRVQEQR